MSSSFPSTRSSYRFMGEILHIAELILLKHQQHLLHGRANILNLVRRRRDDDLQVEPLIKDSTPAILSSSILLKASSIITSPMESPPMLLR